MWATLAIASALSLAPAQTGKLEIKNDRITYGILGQERKESKILAGDLFFVSFDLEGLKVQEDGRVRYSIGMELINNKTGKAEFTRTGEEPLEATNALGGMRHPAFAFSEIGTDTVPGEYTLKLTVTDLVNKDKPTATLSRKFEVLPKAFGFVRVNLTTPPIGPQADTIPVPALQVVGQSCMVNFALVGFEVDAKTMQPNLSVEMRILDDSGKATTAKPFVGTADKNIPKEFRNIVPMQFLIALNRPGTYTIELTATDNMGTKKTAKQTMKLTVLDLPK
jgi:hypothetical protein